MPLPSFSLQSLLYLSFLLETLVLLAFGFIQIEGIGYAKWIYFLDTALFRSLFINVVAADLFQFFMFGVVIG
jgi:hypothetical protein